MSLLAWLAYMLGLVTLVHVETSSGSFTSQLIFAGGKDGGSVY